MEIEVGLLLLLLLTTSIITMIDINSYYVASYFS